MTIDIADAAADEIDDLITDNWTVKRVARFLDMDRAQITRMLQRGEIADAFRVGRSWRVPREAVLAYRAGLQEREKRVLQTTRRG